MSPRRPAARIASALRASWASFWIFGVPKDLWGVLCVWPACFLAVASYLWEPSSEGARLILLGAVWDLMIGFWLTLSVMNRAQNALAAMIRSLRDCSYTPIGWSRIRRGDDADVIDGSSLFNYMGRRGLPYDHSEDVRFFRVDMGESGVIPGGLGVFNIPFAETVILVRDDPKNAEVEERFCLYHELGHSLGYEFAWQSALHKGVKLPLMALGLAAVVMPYGASSLLTLFCCLVGLLLVHVALRRRGRDFRALAEMRADQFAIGFLNAEEKRYVLQHVASVLPQDQELSALEHETRIIAARSLLETGVDLTQSHPGMSNRAFLLETQIAALNLGAWMIMLASLIGAPGAEVVRGFQWLIAAVIVLILLRVAMNFVRGLVLELVFIGRITWQDGKFRLRRGPSRAPAPLT